MLYLFFSSFSSHAQFQIDVPETWETDVWFGTEWAFASIVTYTFNTDCLPNRKGYPKLLL
ncbi:hypothetical protein [Lacinutrix sp. Bg11-31]|uniref:hypothetical protein n=1 Tax=Lacinutrix sp. Bg11-31 TaxID=2057808 RepID=UPI0012FDFD97|nr:hypothetical protein [Lacinutrix sp. Bg11-31]